MLCGVEQLYNELMEELQHSAPTARLTARLRGLLESLPPDERCALVSRTRDGCAPLFEAARRGNAEAVQYLLHVCAAPLEQRGVFLGHAAPPLWAAAVSGHVAAVRALLDAGADVHARSDSASTAVRSACYAGREDVVRLLLARGADVAAPSAAGGTCLINALHVPSLVRHLLEAGAPMHAADARGRTALHHAARERLTDTARMLLEAGADPDSRSLDGDDALREAAVSGATGVVELLSEGAGAARTADALELLGASRLERSEDTSAALAVWVRATRLREEEGALKAAGEVRALGGLAEWRTREQLAALTADDAGRRMQALLVAARVLGDQHPDTMQRFMRRGAVYSEERQYERCVQLWGWALRSHIQRDSLHHDDTTEAMCALTRVLMDMHAGGGARAEVAAEHALQLLEQLAAAMRDCGDGAGRDAALRCAVHAALAARPGARLQAALEALVALDARTDGGSSALHLVCSRLCIVRSALMGRGRIARCFPSAECARRLLAAGADVHATDAKRATPLHVAAVPYNFSNELVEALLEGGAHLDRPNWFGDSALELLQQCPGSEVRVLRHVSLACSAARVLARRPLPPSVVLPRSLRDLVQLHAV